MGIILGSSKLIYASKCKERKWIWHLSCDDERDEGAKESGTVLLECKNGVWEPLAPEDILEK